jgi:hypothetical protein
MGCKVALLIPGEAAVKTAGGGYCNGRVLSKHSNGYSSRNTKCLPASPPPPLCAPSSAPSYEQDSSQQVHALDVGGGRAPLDTYPSC